MRNLMRNLVVEEGKFAETHPSLGYTCDLTDLAFARTIVNGRKNGYMFELTECRPEAGVRPNSSYHLTASPLGHDLPAYCADQSGIVKADYDGSARNCLKNGQGL